jgi:hypothetical protein
MSGTITTWYVFLGLSLFCFLLNGVFAYTVNVTIHTLLPMLGTLFAIIGLALVIIGRKDYKY